MNRRILLALSVCAVLAGCQKAAAPTSDPIVFSILSAESQASAEKDFQPLLDDMSKALGQPVKAYYATNYTAMVEAMRFKQTALGWFTNQSGRKAVRRSGGEVFARTTNAQGPDGYESVILVKKGSGLTLDKILACDKTLNFGIGDAKSTSGTLAPMTFLFAPRNIEPATCFKTVRSANHETNLFAVAGGLMDVVTNNTASIDRMTLLKTDIARNTLKNIEIIWRSPRIPEDPLVWRKDLDPALKAKIAKFLFSYGTGEGPEAARQKAIMNQLQLRVFEPANDTHLLPVREMEATGQLLEGRNRKRADEITKAEAALAQIAKERTALK